MPVMSSSSRPNSPYSARAFLNQKVAVPVKNSVSRAVAVVADRVIAIVVADRVIEIVGTTGSSVPTTNWIRASLAGS